MNTVIGCIEDERSTGLKHKYRIIDYTAPLVYLVHGRAGNHDVMWAFKRSIPDNFSIIAPQAPLVDPVGGWSWWEVKEGHRGEYAGAIAAAGLLRGFIDRSIKHYCLQPRKIVAFGFSQGAGLLSLLLQRDTNLFDGVAMLAGFTMKDRDAKMHRNTKIFMAHGTRDETIPLDLAKQGLVHFKDLGFEVEIHEDPVTHKIGPNGIRNLSNWMKQFEVA